VLTHLFFNLANDAAMMFSPDCPDGLPPRVRNLPSGMIPQTTPIMHGVAPMHSVQMPGGQYYVPTGDHI
jgi:hypothetical protein